MDSSTWLRGDQVPPGSVLPGQSQAACVPQLTFLRPDHFFPPPDAERDRARQVNAVSKPPSNCSARQKQQQWQKSDGKSFSPRVPAKITAQCRGVPPIWARFMLRPSSSIGSNGGSVAPHGQAKEENPHLACGQECAGNLLNGAARSQVGCPSLLCTSRL